MEKQPRQIKLFTFQQINSDTLICQEKHKLEYNGDTYKYLVCGYTDIDTKYSIYQSLTTGKLLYTRHRGPKHCIGSKMKKSTYKYFEYVVPEKYDKIFSGLKTIYNNYLEVLSTKTNQSFILI